MSEYTREEQSANRRTWVEALRSGKYKQGRVYLRRRDVDDPDSGDKFCCLGVACDLYDEAMGTDNWGSVQPGDVYKPYEEYNSGLPPWVEDWLGVESLGGLVDEDNMLTDSLADKNDGGANFDTIADIIESGGLELYRGYERELKNRKSIQTQLDAY